MACRGVNILGGRKGLDEDRPDLAMLGMMEREGLQSKKDLKLY